MTEGTSIQGSHQYDTPERCSLCDYPSWSAQRRQNEGLLGGSVYIKDCAAASASADQGCDGCKLISQLWHVAIPGAIERQKSRIWFDLSAGHSGFRILDSDTIEGTFRRFDILTLHEEPSFMHVRVASLLPSSTHLEHNLARIQTWISACEQVHPECNVPATFTPLRLLDLGTEDTAIVKLIELRPATNIRYACLSHCWGKTICKHITMSENLAANMNGIPVEELPKTFRDAVSVARALELRYLWIDSLCIVQDSEPDWATHVEAMAAIYENGYITLAAGAHDSDDGGFFTATKDVFEDPHLLKIELGGHVYNIYMRASIDHPHVYNPVTTALPLMKRGWCLQEQLLSRRYLCFGTEILWECLQEVACSCSIALGPFNPRRLGAMPKFRNCPPIKIQFSSASGDHRTVWRDVVSEYNSRQLTYPSDKLPALAGLATAFQRKYRPGTYHYGMWSSSLEHDLAWFISGSESSPKHDRSGPSWSWTQAYDGKVLWWPIRGQYQYFRLLQITELGSATEDQVHHSPRTALVLSGTLFSISLQTWTKSFRLQQFHDTSRRCRIFEHPEQLRAFLQDDHGLTPNSSNKIDQVPIYDPSPDYDAGTFWPDNMFWSSETELQNQLQDVKFMPLEFDIPGIGGDDRRRPTDVAGLVLRPVEWKATGKWVGLDTFERIGFLQCYSWTPKEDTATGGRKVEFLLV